MSFKEDPSTAADYLRKAVPLMVQRQIPTNPHNYALWYSHVANSNPELSRKLLFEFPTPGSYDPDKSEQLFFEYFVKHHLPNSDSAQDALAAVLTQLFGAVNKTSEGTHQFGRSLQSTIDTVESTDNTEQIQQALNDLLQETDAVEALNKEFQSELEKARAEVESLKGQLETSEQTALLDELTQIGNRRQFDQWVDDAVSDDLVTTSLVLLDIDHFKQCNDNYGHQMGDIVLAKLGAILKQHQQGGIRPCRYGGEEFAVLFDGSATEAVRFAEKIRAALTACQFEHDGKTLQNLTASVGISESQFGDSAESLIKRADEALYSAKSNGRNRAEIG